MGARTPLGSSLGEEVLILSEAFLRVDQLELGPEYEN